MPEPSKLPAGGPLRRNDLVMDVGVKAILVKNS
jgi:hypothetical protein